MFFAISGVYSLILAYCSRFFCPKEIVFPPDKKSEDAKPVVVYMNINLSHECWPDLRKFKILTIVDGYISTHVANNTHK